MQHPDEGTIHSWLDGALPVDEAARVESHIAECPECAAAVAEARGFIAASSRILTALDDAPRGVIPAVPVRRRDNRVAWRAAAGLLIVAAGSLVVFRNGVDEKSIATIGTPTIGTSTTATVSAGAPTISAGALDAAANAVPPTGEASKKSPAADEPASARALDSSGGAIGTTVASTPDRSVQGFAQTQMSAMSAAGDFAGKPDLRIVSTSRVLGGNRTVYEVAPTQTVTLLELDTTKLSEIVVTGAATRRESVQQSTAKTARPAEKSVAQSAVSPPAAAILAAPVSPSARLEENTIRWKEVATGKELVLSGRFPIEELQRIRLRLERERADLRGKTP